MRRRLAAAEQAFDHALQRVLQLIFFLIYHAAQRCRRLLLSACCTSMA